MCNEMPRPSGSKDPRVAARILNLIRKYQPISTHKLLEKYAARYGSCSGRWLSRYLDFLTGLGIIYYDVSGSDRYGRILYGGWRLTREYELTMKIYGNKHYWLVIAFWLFKRNPKFMFGDLKGKRFREFIGFPRVEPRIVYDVVESLIRDEICLKCFANYNELWPIKKIRKDKFRCQNPRHRDEPLKKELQKEIEEICRIINRCRLQIILEK